MSLAGGTASVGVAVGKISRKRRTKVSVTVGKAGQRLAVELQSPVAAKLGAYIEANRNQMVLPYQICRQGEFAGQTLAICGAGPSLAKAVIEGVDQIWACNSALPYLVSKGVNVTAGVGIDQTAVLVKEWESRPDVQYYIASSCDPALVRMLIGPLANSMAGHEVAARRVAWFHNYVGIKDEVALYKRWPKPMLMVTTGHTVVSRIIGLARWMGFGRIDIYGADCALGPDDVAHADGESASSAYRNPLIFEGEIGGRRWRTRPDMLMGAVDLVRQVRVHNGTIRLLGDTLPVALLDKSDDFLDRVARTLAPGELPPTD